jgi:hypothetical protein
MMLIKTLAAVAASGGVLRGRDNLKIAAPHFAGATINSVRALFFNARMSKTGRIP